MEDNKKTASEPLSVSLYGWLQTFTGVLVGIILVFLFLGRITPVDGSSMEPTLQDRDLMLVQAIGYTPKQGDVVILTKPFRNVTGPIVKRVIAVGGQHVDIDYDANQIYVDGDPLYEPYLDAPMQEPGYPNQSSVTVPEGSIFVMGDNRNHSNDSRDVTLSTVDTRYVLGRAQLIFFPFQDFGFIR